MPFKNSISRLVMKVQVSIRIKASLYTVSWPVLQDQVKFLDKIILFRLCKVFFSWSAILNWAEISPLAVLSRLADPDPDSHFLETVSGSEFTLKWKAGSASALQSNSGALHVQNVAERGRGHSQMKAWRLQDQWSHIRIKKSDPDLYSSENLDPQPYFWGSNPVGYYSQGCGSNPIGFTTASVG